MALYVLCHREKATVKDAIGGETDYMTDGRGRTVATVRYKNSSEHDDIVVKTEYDALNRPVKVTHPNGGSSTYTYDKAGNVTAYTSPDAGTVKMKYTPQGQVLERTTPTGVIKYEYDFERLQKTTSTSNADNALTDEVFYLYGNADDKADNITQIYGSQNSYEQQYEYDEFNRLIHATGKGPGVFNSGKNCSYDVSYTYNIMSGFDKVSKNIQKYDENKNGFVSIEENNAYLYGWDDENGRYSKHYYAGTQRMASRVEFMPKGMGDEPQQPEQAEQPDSQEQASEMASGQTSGQTELTDGNGNANGEKQPSKEEKEAMREYQKLQKMEVAKVDASGGSESASGTEESEAVEPDLYYYHTDHLGSTTFITDRNGDIAQYLAYTPYGETFIEERNVTYTSSTARN